ncbi:hypothetical protein [Kitasatospora sp. NPDC059571]|uniref:hypothetical protein n=1 Tax=Kitasatospora sp. NPDC059571 TaxID=3346871 RepID=UPI0036975446
MDETETRVPLADGDLRWVFPEPAAPRRITGLLAETDALVRELAERTAPQAGPGARPGDGLAYHTVLGRPLAGVFGLVPVGDVVLRAGLFFGRRCAWDLRSGPPWTVEVSVEVIHPAEQCGGHLIEELANITCETPEAAPRNSCAECGASTPS